MDMGEAPSGVGVAAAGRAVVFSRRLGAFAVAAVVRVAGSGGFDDGGGAAVASALGPFGVRFSTDPLALLAPSLREESARPRTREVAFAFAGLGAAVCSS
jgi:hypothetical protein